MRDRGHGQVVVVGVGRGVRGRVTDVLLLLLMSCGGVGVQVGGG